MAFFDGWKRADGPEFHALIAAIGCAGGLFAGLPVWLILAINTTGWLALEIGQGISDDKGPWPWSGRWGWRKRLELIAPVVVGAAVVAGLEMWA